MQAYKNTGNNMTDNTRIALLEQSIVHINETMVRIEKRLDTIDTDLKQGFKDVNNRIWSLYYWMIGGFSSVLLILAHAVHWI